MRYPVDCESSFKKTYLFWLSRFIRNKLNTLSNRQVKDKKKFAFVLGELIKSFDSIEKLKTLIKDVRNAGMSGIHVYYLPLEKLYNYLMNFGASSMKEIDEEILFDFLAIETANLSAASKKNHRIAILSFFGYIDAQNEDEDEKRHIFDIKLKNWRGLSGKSGTKLPAYMDNQEVVRFIEHIDKYDSKNRAIGARNRLIVKLILYTGIRVGEAIDIKIKDMIKESDLYLIKVRGKGNKPRVVMIKEKHISNELSIWLDGRSCNNNLLFCNKKGGSLTQAYIGRIVRDILISAGIKKEKNSSHMLRHTFATLLYQKSRDLVLLQEALGHEDINTSRIYTHFDTENLKKTTDIY